MEIDLTNIIIREVGFSEIEVLTKYRLEYLTELQGPQSLDYQVKLKKELSEYFKNAIAQNSFFAYMAQADGRILSFGAMVLKKIPGDFNCSSYTEGDILNMYTIPEARNKGVSTLILKRLIDEASARGISKISLHTTKAGEKIYRKFGFSEPVYPVLELIINQ